MGGKNPTIVLDDADLGLAVRLAVMGGFALTGQSCTATSRVIVEEGIADRFAAALAEAANSLNVGDGLEDGVQMGPAVSEEQLATDLDYVRIGREEGAELLAGGGKAGDGGHFLRPTVFDGVDVHSRLAQEEIFGPVIGIVRARDLDDAIFKANAVGYGLAASVVTNDLRRAMTFVDRIEAGVVKVNEPTTGLALQAPFGGFKQSSANTFKEQGPAARRLLHAHQDGLRHLRLSRAWPAPATPEPCRRRPPQGYSRTMAADGDSERYVLFVTGPSRERLYRRFTSLFDGRDDVDGQDRPPRLRAPPGPARPGRRASAAPPSAAAGVPTGSSRLPKASDAPGGGLPGRRPPLLDLYLPSRFLGAQTFAYTHSRPSRVIVVEVVEMLLMGESINGTRKQVAEAIQARDAEFIKTLAKDQIDAGAGLIDVNGGVAGGDEVADLLWLIDIVMGVTDMQLMVDSANPKALDAGVQAIVDRGGKVPFINSISGEQPRIDAVLPMIEKYKCPVVGLCLSDEGIPPTAEDRFAVAQQIYDLCTGAGLPAEDLWIDPLVMAVSADPSAPGITMETLKLVKERLPVRTTGGLSNVSFGLPNRALLNRTFVAMCAGLGLDGLIVDVRNKQMMATIKSVEALRGEDNFCGSYLKAHRAGILE